MIIIRNVNELLEFSCVPGTLLNFQCTMYWIPHQLSEVKGIASLYGSRSSLRSGPNELIAQDWLTPGTTPLCVCSPPAMLTDFWEVTYGQISRSLWGSQACMFYIDDWTDLHNCLKPFHIRGGLYLKDQFSRSWWSQDTISTLSLAVWSPRKTEFQIMSCKNPEGKCLHSWLCSCVAWHKTPPYY